MCAHPCAFCSLPPIYKYMYIYIYIYISSSHDQIKLKGVWSYLQCSCGDLCHGLHSSLRYDGLIFGNQIPNDGIMNVIFIYLFKYITISDRRVFIKSNLVGTLNHITQCTSILLKAICTLSSYTHTIQTMSFPCFKWGSLCHNRRSKSHCVYWELYLQKQAINNYDVMTTWEEAKGTFCYLRAVHAEAISNKPAMRIHKTNISWKFIPFSS